LQSLLDKTLGVYMINSFSQFVLSIKESLCFVFLC